MLGMRKIDDPGRAAAVAMAAPQGAEQALPATSPKLLDRLREALRSRHYTATLRAKRVIEKPYNHCYVL